MRDMVVDLKSFSILILDHLESKPINRAIGFFSKLFHLREIEVSYLCLRKRREICKRKEEGRSKIEIVHENRGGLRCIQGESS